jgi:catalase
MYDAAAGQNAMFSVAVLATERSSASGARKLHLNNQRLAAGKRCSMATTTQKYRLAVLILAAGLAPVAAQDAVLETQLVDAMNKAYGVHPGFRANHAKGVVAEGTFKAAPAAARLSKAVIFR